jgi:hypothetical protein
MVLARRNAVATQENFVPRSRASEMVGRAVLVTLPSRAERSSGMHMAMKERQNPSDRFHLVEGVKEGRDGGKVGRLRRRERALLKAWEGSVSGLLPKLLSSITKSTLRSIVVVVVVMREAEEDIFKEESTLP